jgi:D-alanyl-D-alanine dipeptidase
MMAARGVTTVKKRLVFCLTAASAVMLALATSPAMHPFTPQTPTYQVNEVTPIPTSPAKQFFTPQTRAAQTGARSGDLLEIPLESSVAGWKETPIRDTGEPLVSLEGLDTRVVIGPSCGHPFLRRGAADRLALAAQALPSGYRLLVLDAHRTLAEQNALFEDAMQQFSTQYPEKSGAEIRELAKMYASVPSSDPRTPPPHTTGGAIDITILGPDGPLDMGPSGHQAEAATSFYRGRVGPPLVQENRRLLYTVMVEVGFTNYPLEWWHYDYGDQFWGHLSKRDAIYGLVED